MPCQWRHVFAIDNDVVVVVVVVTAGCAADCVTRCLLRDGERNEIPTVHQNDSPSS